MTHFSDGVRVGDVFPTQCTDRVSPQNVTPQPGAPMSPIYVYSVIPIATTTTGLGVGATYSGAPVTLTLSNGASVSTTTSINGVTYYDLGFMRGVTVSGASTGVTVVNITFSGLDSYLIPVTVTMSGPLSTASVTTPKTLRYLHPSVSISGNTTSTISFGAGDRVGFPYYLSDFGFVDITWSSAKITASTGFVSGSTVTATAATSDVRGYYDLQTTANGTRRFTAWICIRDPDTLSGIYGVPQF